MFDRLVNSLLRMHSIKLQIYLCTMSRFTAQLSAQNGLVDLRKCACSASCQKHGYIPQFSLQGPRPSIIHGTHVAVMELWLSNSISQQGGKKSACTSVSHGGVIIPESQP
jgi:hypothetical protein